MEYPNKNNTCVALRHLFNYTTPPRRHRYSIGAASSWGSSWRDKGIYKGLGNSDNTTILCSILLASLYYFMMGTPGRRRFVKGRKPTTKQTPVKKEEETKTSTNTTSLEKTPDKASTTTLSLSKSDAAAQILFSYYQQKTANEILDENSVDWEHKYFQVVNDLTTIVTLLENSDSNKTTTEHVKTQLKDLLKSTKRPPSDSVLMKQATRSAKKSQTVLDQHLPEFVGQHLDTLEGTTVKSVCQELELIHKTIYATKENTAPTPQASNRSPKLTSKVKIRAKTSSTRPRIECVAAASTNTPKSNSSSKRERSSEEAEVDVEPIPDTAPQPKASPRPCVRAKKSSPFESRPLFARKSPSKYPLPPSPVATTKTRLFASPPSSSKKESTSSPSKYPLPPATRPFFVSKKQSPLKDPLTPSPLAAAVTASSRPAGRFGLFSPE